MSTSIETDRSLQLSFQLVTEVPKANLAGIFDDIERRRIRHADSYGAFLVRGLTWAERKQAGQLLEALYGSPAKLSRADFDSLIDNDTPLHADSRDKNEITIHTTHAGAAEAVVLVGSSRQHAFGSSYLGNRALTLLMFKEGVLDSGMMVSAPDIAYKTRLEAGDTLIFDHSQLHAFHSLTPDRASTAQFVDYL